MITSPSLLCRLSSSVSCFCLLAADSCCSLSSSMSAKHLQVMSGARSQSGSAALLSPTTSQHGLCPGHLHPDLSSCWAHHPDRLILLGMLQSGQPSCSLLPLLRKPQHLWPELPALVGA